MTPSSENPVMLFVLTGKPAPALARLAMRHGWPVRCVSRSVQAIEQIRHGQPEVVVVQIALPPGEEIDLIQRARSGPLDVSLVAVAVSHDASIEREVRSAGAHGYCAVDAQASLVEPMINEMLERHTRDTPTARSAGTAA